MSRRAVPVRVYLLILASAGFVAAPLLDVCHRPDGHHGHGHAHAATGAHGEHYVPDDHARAHRPPEATVTAGSTLPAIAVADGAEAARSALGDDRTPITHHDEHLACFTATLQTGPELVVGGTSALHAPASLTEPPRLALGPATPPP